MEKCNDYWCDYYGKGHGECDRCEKKSTDKDSPELRVVYKRRADKQMEITKKYKGQTR